MQNCVHVHVMTVVQSEIFEGNKILFCVFWFIIKKHKVPPVVIYAVPMHNSEIQSCLHYIFLFLHKMKYNAYSWLVLFCCRYHHIVYD